MSSVNHKPIVINNMATNKAIFSNLQSIQKLNLKNENDLQYLTAIYN